MTEIALSGVVERDIDFLLVEEFVASDGFLAWFLDKVGVAHGGELVAISHSATSATGETDIELTIKTPAGPLMLLLENKINANLQPRQAERYRARTDRYVSEGQASAAISVIVAPQTYFPQEVGSLGFDKVITYEEILDWFRITESLGPRKQSKLALLQEALARGSAGWLLVPDVTATGFWRRYWELSCTLAPELRMDKPDAKPATSTFIRFRPAWLPKGVNLIHKLTYGNVDIQLAGKGTALEAVNKKFGALLEPRMSIEAAGKSAVIRVRVPSIDIQAPFTESEPAVKEGIWAAKLLSLWAKRASLWLLEAVR